MRSNRFLILFVACIVTFNAGCGGKPQLMPTPNLYAKAGRDPFPDVPAELRTNKVDVLYLTDRKPLKDSTPENRSYGYGRSRRVAFGVATVEIGKNVAWDDLVKASRTAKRSLKLPLSVRQTRETRALPADTRRRWSSFQPQPSQRRSRPRPPQPCRWNWTPRSEQCKAELSAHLAKTPVKEVYVFVHGYNNNFDDAVTTIAAVVALLRATGRADRVHLAGGSRGGCCAATPTTASPASSRSIT